jgi:hypothetical protein
MAPLIERDDPKLWRHQRHHPAERKRGVGEAVEHEHAGATDRAAVHVVQSNAIPKNDL